MRFFITNLHHYYMIIIHKTNKRSSTPQSTVATFYHFHPLYATNNILWGSLPPPVKEPGGYYMCIPPINRCQNVLICSYNVWMDPFSWEGRVSYTCIHTTPPHKRVSFATSFLHYDWNFHRRRNLFKISSFWESCGNGATEDEEV